MRYYTLKLVGEDSTHIETGVSEAFLTTHYGVEYLKLNESGRKPNSWVYIKEVYPDELFIRYESFQRED